ncbi:hypothetical protein NC651_025041 [Populus alba x Populus x berolinensis]|nr:hypothetical protein NC651_025041 [Populus alba x Populus x berolinensis]
MDKSKTNERDAGEQMKKDTWLLKVQPHKPYGLTSVEVILRHDRKAQGTLPHSQRSLKDVDMQGMDTKKSAQANKTFDPSQTSKRRVRRGSDPIHNREMCIEKLLEKMFTEPVSSLCYKLRS